MTVTQMCKFYKSVIFLLPSPCENRAPWLALLIMLADRWNCLDWYSPLSPPLDLATIFPSDVKSLHYSHDRVCESEVLWLEY